MITSTIIVVLFSTVVCLLEVQTFIVFSIRVNKHANPFVFPLSKQVFGSITKPLIEAVMLRHAKPSTSDATDIPSLEELRLLFIESGDQSEQNRDESSAFPKRSSFRLLVSHPTTTVHYFWRKFDDKFMRPVFGGRGFVPGSSSSGAADETS